MTMILQSLFCASACGIQYWIYGYSLYQSRTSNPILGDLSLAAFRNVLAQPSQANADIPDILCAPAPSSVFLSGRESTLTLPSPDPDAAFGFTFVSATAMILAGAMLERGRLFPSMVFLLCWTTFVYYMYVRSQDYYSDAAR